MSNTRRRILEVHTDKRTIGFRTAETRGEVALIVNAGERDYCLEGLDVEELYDLVKYVLEGRPPDAEIRCGFTWQIGTLEVECCLSADHDPIASDIAHVTSRGTPFCEDVPF